MKCGGANIPEVFASELPNNRGTKIIPHVWLGLYTSRVEFRTSGVPTVSRRATPYLGVKKIVFEGSG